MAPGLSEKARKARSGVFPHVWLDQRELRGAIQRMLDLPRRRVPANHVDALVGQVNESLAEGLAVCSPRGHIAYANTTLCAMLGRRRSELVGARVVDVLGKQPAPPARREARLTTKKGRNIVVDLRTRPLEGPRGERLGSLCVLVDISTQAHALHRTEGELRLLAAQFAAAQQLERRSIARELHDGIGQALGYIQIGLDTCSELMARSDRRIALRTIGKLSRQVRSALEELRRISVELGPAALEELGVLTAIGQLARDLKSVSRALDVGTIVEVSEAHIPASARAALYRIAQEACSNAVSHSQARKLLLSLTRRNGRIELVIRDDGIGFDPAQFATPDAAARGLGLASMRERAEASGGRWRIESRPGAGTLVRASWPALQIQPEKAHVTRIPG